MCAFMALMSAHKFNREYDSYANSHFKNYSYNFDNMIQYILNFVWYRSSVMLSCWSKDSFERPSFSDIVCQLEKIFQFPNIVQEVGFTCYSGIKYIQIVVEL